jgi:hypothetical protein
VTQAFANLKTTLHSQPVSITIYATEKIDLSPSIKAVIHKLYMRQEANGSRRSAQLFHQPHVPAHEELQ